MKYADYREYEKAMKRREEFRKASVYETFDFALCMECKHFKSKTSHIYGDCGLMEQEGAYSGVMAQAVCNRFLSNQGTDINGKAVEPSLLPAWVKNS
jgi:hypothetical protein